MDSYCEQGFHDLVFKKLKPISKGLRYKTIVKCTRCKAERERIYERKNNVWFYEDFPTLKVIQ